MRYPNTRQELEDMIRRAFDVDRRLPRVGHKGIESPIWKLVMIPDDERSPEDVLEDLAESRMNITREDLALWETVSGWMRLIHGIRRAVVKKRCQGMGWKRILLALVAAVVVWKLSVSPILFILLGAVGGILWTFLHTKREKR